MRARDEMQPESRHGNAQSDLGKTAVLVAVVATLVIGGVLAFALSKAPFRFQPNEKLYGRPDN